MRVRVLESVCVVCTVGRPVDGGWCVVRVCVCLRMCFVRVRLCVCGRTVLVLSLSVLLMITSWFSRRTKLPRLRTLVFILRLSIVLHATICPVDLFCRPRHRRQQRQ